MLAAIYAAIPKPALAIGVAVLSALLVGQTLVAHRNAEKLAEERTARAQEREAYATAASAMERRQREREHAWAGAHQEITDAYTIVARELADASAAAAAAGGRLHDAAAAAARRSRACQGAAAAGGGAAASDPAGVLADVLRRADDRAGVLAAHADAARAAGLACERAYDALMARP